MLLTGGGLGTGEGFGRGDCFGDGTADLEGVGEDRMGEGDGDDAGTRGAEGVVAFWATGLPLLLNPPAAATTRANTVNSAIPPTPR